MTVFACQSSDHNIEKVRWKKNNERKPIFNQDKFFFIFLWWSCLDLLEIALLFYKNSRIHFRWEMLTNILSICYIFLEKKIALFKKTGKKKQFCLKMDVLSIFCFPSPFLYYDLNFDMQTLSNAWARYRFTARA